MRERPKLHPKGNLVPPHLYGWQAIPRALASGLALKNEFPGRPKWHILIKLDQPRKPSTTLFLSTFQVILFRKHPNFHLVTDMFIVRGEIHDWSALVMPFHYETISFRRAAITKYHTLTDLSHKQLFSHNSGGWKSESRCWQSHASSEGTRGESAPGLCLSFW